VIRINLLGQARPKAARKAVPIEATLQVVFALIAVAAAFAVLGITYYTQKNQLDAANKKIAALRAEKASLESVKQDVDRFESEKSVLQERVDVIESLQRNRSGAQQLLEMVANTVVRVDSLWLTTLDRTGNSLNIEGEAGSINSVANLITELKRSGYFDKVEIKEAKEDDLEPTVQTFHFSMTADVNAAWSGSPAKAEPAAATGTSPAPAKGGKS